MTLEELQKEIRPADQDVIRQSEERWMKVGKPLFSLGKLEQQITRIAGIKRIACYELKKKALVVMCAPALFASSARSELLIAVSLSSLVMITS